MNTLQRKVLIVVALVILVMLLFPPFLCQTIGIGYAFIFSTTGRCSVMDYPGAINAAQLVVQWLGVAVLGAIAFALAHTKPKPIEPAKPVLNGVQIDTLWTQLHKLQFENDTRQLEIIELKKQIAAMSKVIKL